MAARTRLVLCMGAFCNQYGRAKPLEHCLRDRLGETGPAWRAEGPLRWETANCLSMCGAGPNVVVYPDETSHHQMTVAKLNALLDALLAADE